MNYQTQSDSLPKLAGPPSKGVTTTKRGPSSDDGP